MVQSERKRQPYFAALRICMSGRGGFSTAADGPARQRQEWPAPYREWRRVQGRAPDLGVMAYDTSDAAVRADLKAIAVSSA